MIVFNIVFGILGLAVIAAWGYCAYQDIKENA